MPTGRPHEFKKWLSACQRTNSRAGQDPGNRARAYSTRQVESDTWFEKVVCIVRLNG